MTVFDCRTMAAFDFQCVNNNGWPCAGIARPYWPDGAGLLILVFDLRSYAAEDGTSGHTCTCAAVEEFARENLGDFAQAPKRL